MAALVNSGNRVAHLSGAQGRTLAGVACETPPPLHCGGDQCAGELLRNQGNATEPKTGRQFFLDYPCDLKPNDRVVFILSLHGAGSIGNWQRHYFPAMDYKEKYRLVIATPTAATSQPITPGAPAARMWTSAADDVYLQNVVDYVLDEVGRKNVKAFWLAGHSQGGLTSNRIIRTDYFKDKVDGWLSLSGGRLGGNPGRGDFSAMARGTTPSPGGGRGAAPAGAPARGAIPGAGAATGLPANDFSFIYETGRREMDDKGLPETSEWAAKYSCGLRRKLDDVVDTKAGYIFDGSRQNPPVPAWGLRPAPGTANVYTYPSCKDGRVVADIVRLDKGHTEGLEPNVTETLVKLMLSAPGGKLQKAAGTR